MARNTYRESGRSKEWGIIGPGNIAKTFVEDLKLLDPPQRIKSVLGHTPQKTVEFAQHFGIPYVFTNFDEFLDKGRPDAVYIATPHTLHYEQAVACLENKIPVLCEKPITINADQCRQLIDLAHINNTFLMEGMWIRFLPSIQQVINLIEKGVIGKIVSIKASISFKAPRKDNRYFDASLGGGSLLDLGVYAVFLATLFLGKPESVKAIGRLTEQGVDETCSVLLDYANGAYAMLESSLLSQSDLPAEISGEKGIIKILHPWYEKASGIELNRYGGDGKIVYACSWEGHGFQFEAKEVINCINSGKISSDLLPHALTLSTMEIMDEIRQQVHVSYEVYE